MKREFRVCDEGEKLHVREDICKGADSMSHKEARIQKKFPYTKKAPPVDSSDSDSESSEGEKKEASKDT